MQVEISSIEVRYARLHIREASREQQVLAALAEQGQKSPLLVVRAEGDAERWVLIDGHVRLRALGRLGIDLAEVLVLEMSEAEALIFAHRLSSQHRVTALEEGWLLAELVESYGKTLAELGAELGRTVSWVSRRLALVRVLPDNAQQAVRSGKIAAQGAMRALVPLARANKLDCERLVANLGSEKLSVRPLEQLYAAWRNADREGRERIVSAPLLYLKVIAELEAEAPAGETQGGDVGALVTRDLAAIAALCRRACRHITSPAFATIAPAARADVRSALADTKLAFAALDAAGEAHGGCHAGPGDTHGHLALEA